MKIFGKKFTKNDILKKIGDISQLGGLRCYELTDGPGRGIRAIDLKTPCGLDMTILPDRGMDISALFYKSIPICWKSITRETSPVYYESRGLEWFRTFFGGLLTTCGLTYFGQPCKDGDEELGLHGRISNIASENVTVSSEWEDETYVLTVQGKVREVKVFGDKLQLTRKIIVHMDIPKIVIEDTVENIGYDDSPHMILYHINIGFPVIDSSSRLIEDRATVTPVNDEANKSPEDFACFSEPIKNFKQQVYLHDIVADMEGYSNIAIVNENFNNNDGIGIWLRFEKKTLPFLLQWKQMGEGEYACGIEPLNGQVGNRCIKRERGDLYFIKPGEKIQYKLELNILGSNRDIKKFKDDFHIN